MMLNSHKNELFNIIRALNLQPEQFDISVHKRQVANAPSLSETVVTFRKTSFSFRIQISPSSFDRFAVYFTRFAPGFPTSGRNPDVNYLNTSELFGLFRRWLEIVVIRYLNEQQVPDFWSNLREVSLNVHTPTLADDVRPTKFDVREHEQVERTLDTIKALLVTYAERNEKTIDRISQDIQELKENAKDQNRKAFFQQVAGYILSTATSMALAPEQTRALFEALKRGLDRIIKFLN